MPAPALRPCRPASLTLNTQNDARRHADELRNDWRIANAVKRSPCGKAGVWYLVARAASIRTYRVSRILELAILPERFERPDEFDLAAYWERSVAAYEDSLPSFPAIVRIRGDGLARLPNALGPVRAREAITAAGDPDEEGWLTLELRLVDFWNAELMLLQLGPHAEVLEPVELRRQIADATRSMAERYR
jgi:predicted DNA-binding transcriptional regulator YafY